jgi:hypothetical protein
MGTAKTFVGALSLLGLLLVGAARGGDAAAAPPVSVQSSSPASPTTHTDPVGLTDTVAQLHRDLDSLQKAFTALDAKLDSVMSGADQQNVSELITEIALLRAELAAVANANHKRPQTADLDFNAYPPEAEIESSEEDGITSDERLDISGFFDVLGSYQESAYDNTELGLGQVEIDLAAQVSPAVTLGISPIYNNEDADLEVGAAEVDILLASGRTGFITSVNLAAGMFDVPFGIDYHCYCSIDRKLVTTPRAVLRTHGCWSDFGARLDLESTWGNLTAYAVNGFASSADVLDVDVTLQTGEETYESVDTSPANALGTRLGITPVSGLEIGGSLAIGLNESDRSEMILTGADLQYTWAGLELTGEYIFHSLNRSIDRQNNQGYYIQGLYTVGRAFLVGRYDTFKSYHEAWDGDLSAGCGYEIAEGVEFRAESVFCEDSDANQSYLQLAVAF